MPFVICLQRLAEEKGAIDQHQRADIGHAHSHAHAQPHRHLRAEDESDELTRTPPRRPRTPVAVAVAPAPAAAMHTLPSSSVPYLASSSLAAPPDRTANPISIPASLSSSVRHVCFTL